MQVTEAQNVRKGVPGKQYIYWYGIKSDIINTVASCSLCAEQLPSLQREPLKTDPRPERAFEQTATDLFHWAGKTCNSLC